MDKLGRGDAVSIYDLSHGLDRFKWCYQTKSIFTPQNRAHFNVSIAIQIALQGSVIALGFILISWTEKHCRLEIKWILRNDTPVNQHDLVNSSFWYNKIIIYLNEFNQNPYRDTELKKIYVHWIMSQNHFCLTICKLCQTVPVMVSIIFAVFGTAFCVLLCAQSSCWWRRPHRLQFLSSIPGPPSTVLA